MSVGAADDDAADGGWGLAEDEDHPPRPVATDAVVGSKTRTDRSDRSETRFASNGDDARRLADLADKENAEASKRRRTSLLGGAAAAAAPAPPRRMHGWKSNWAVEGMAQAKANSLSAPSARETTTRETSPARRGSPPEREKNKGSPSAGALDSEARETAKDFSPRRDAEFYSADVAAASAETEGADADADGDGETGRRAVSAWGSDCDSEDELLAGSGLTSIKTQPSSPGAERRRAASLRAAVAARRPFELGAPPGGAPGAGAAPGPAREIPAASDSSDDDFGIAVSTRGRGKKKAAKSQPATKPATKAAKMKPAPRSPDAPRAFVPRGTVDLVDSDDDFDVVPESDAEADETDNGLASERGRERDHRAAGRDVNPESSSYRGVGGPMSRLPRAPAPAPPAAWRRRLPHFTPASELTKGEYLDGEKVFIDYSSQFDGGGGDAKDFGRRRSVVPRGGRQ
jgi:hypothetical protein